MAIPQETFGISVQCFVCREIPKSKLWPCLFKRGWLCPILPSVVLGSENCFIHLNVTQNEIMLKGLSWQLIFWHKVSWLQIWFYEIWKWFLDACYVYIFIFILIIAGFDYLHICFMIFKHCNMQHWHENYANVGKTKFLN